MREITYLFLFLLLVSAFFMLFREIDFARQLSELFRRTRSDLDAVSRQRTLAGRKQLLELDREHSLLFSLERMLQYSGVKIFFPRLTVEWWIAGNAVILSLFFFGALLVFGLWPSAGAVLFLMTAEWAVLQALRIRNLRRVGESLMKLLDFLGNYSITAAEATGVFSQVSRYMEEPLRSALDTCYYEAQTTGDAGLALLSMAERIEHPKFKELARNMEISIRYCADFSALVSSSRRSLREYLRATQERRGMLREAAVNMALLLSMSLIVLVTVGYLTETSLWALLFDTLPGRIGLCVLLVIFGLFGGKLYRAQC